MATAPSLFHSNLFRNLRHVTCQQPYQVLLRRLCATTTTAPTSTPSSPPPSPPEKEVSKPAQESRWRRLKRLRREWYKNGSPANRPSPTYDRKSVHALSDAIAVVRSNSFAKFDESIELVFRLNIDPRQAAHNLRGTLSLPHGTGRSDQIAVFARSESDVKSATVAGAHLIGGEDLLDRVIATKAKCLKGFTACLATSDMLGDVAGQAGRLLGPKGLLPSLKGGTAIPASEKHVDEFVRGFLKGKVYYRVDKFATLQMVVGKLSFDDEALKENIMFAIREVLGMRPRDVRRKYFKKTVLCSSMGPSVVIGAEDEIKKAAIEEARLLGQGDLMG